ncbi:protein NEDD1-like [Argopecten irradians]|uniref:protein NEDD1-like n=1 Tax=Argopecten irradians TaxID=31199 RepID=UPI00371726EF
MAGIRLASAGDDIKLWDVDSSYSMVQQYNPHECNVCKLCWSHDNSLLASVSNNSDKLSISCLKNSSVTILDLKFLCGRGFLDLNSTSRYIVSGIDQTINVWDLKARSLRKTYKGHAGTVTCAKFNWNDTYIASGSDLGEIIVYNTVSGQGCTPMVAPKAQAIKEIQFSHYQKSLLGSASDDGAVNLWDINTRRLIHSFSDAHQAPATGIKFSPINSIFLISVGLDKRIICYDLEGKKYPKVITAESPLTSVDVMPDGVIVAVGSTLGKIFIYDLRKGDTPVKVLNAHKSSVQCLRFTNDLQTENMKTIPSSKDVSPPNRRKLPLMPVSTNTANLLPLDSSKEPEKILNYSSNRGSYPNQDSMSSSGIFSPLADPGTINHRDNVGASPLLTNQNLSVSFNNSLSINGSRTHQDSYSNMYSSPPGMGTSGRTHQDSYNDKFSSPPETLARTRQGNPHHIQDHVISNGPNPYLQNDLRRSDGDSWGRIDQGQGQSNGYRSSTSPDRRTPSHVARISPSTLSGINASPSLPELNLNDYSPGSCAVADNSGPKQFPSSLEGVNTVTGIVCGSNSAQDQASGSQNSQDQASGGQSSQVQGSRGQSLQSLDTQGVNAGNFQTQLLRNLIREEVEDFYDLMHKDILNLQVEMIRQFQIHQNEVNTLLQHYSVNHDLLAEVEKLREENKQLKKNF